MKLYIDIYKDIQEMLKLGERPVIEVHSIMCDEFMPLDEGMFARIVDIAMEDIAYTDETKKKIDNYSLKLTLDWSEFEEHNLPLMKHDFYNEKTHDYDLTAIEAGQWPKNRQQWTYIGVFANGENDDSFDFVNKDIVTYLEKAKAEGKTLFAWFVEQLEKTKEQE